MSGEGGSKIPKESDIMSQGPTSPTATSPLNRPEDAYGSQRVYKKTSANSALTLYLGSRDVVSRNGIMEPLYGIVYIDPKFTAQKIYCQLTLTFRYGREDEEVMGLKFCNEAIMALKQISPNKVNHDKTDITTLQQALMDRLGKTAYPFKLEVGSLAPPSVQLLPAKRYNGAPIGTSYDVRVYMADGTDEKLQRRTTVKLGVRVIHKITLEDQNIQLPMPSTSNSTVHALPRSLRLRLSPKALKLTNKFCNSTEATEDSDDDDPGGIGGGCIDEHPQKHGGASTNSPQRDTLSLVNTFVSTPPTNDAKKPMLIDIKKGPEGSIDKPFLWAEGRVSLKAALNKSAYSHGEHVAITIDVHNDSRKVIRKIRIFAVQHVDVCMFSNGKFKNVVADVNESYQIKPGERHHKTYALLPIRGATKNWIAVEGVLMNSTVDLNFSNYSFKIASSAPRTPQSLEERNVFAIYVSYYIKVKLTLSGMGGEVSLKLPFILGHIDDGNNSDKNKKLPIKKPTNDDNFNLKSIATLNLNETKSTDTTPTTNDDGNVKPEKTIEELNVNHLNVKCDGNDFQNSTGSSGEIHVIVDEDLPPNTSNREDKNTITSQLEIKEDEKFNENENSDSQSINVIQAQIHRQSDADIES